METSPRSPASAADQPATIFVALELSRASWVVAVHTPLADKIGLHRLKGGDSEGLLALIARRQARVQAALGRAVVTVSCYEAGYDGFWLHRLLEAHGIRNHVLDPASLLVSRRARRAKTDRIDAASLLRTLIAHRRGEPKVVSVVRVPSVAEEDARRLHRERHRLVAERVQHVNRIKGLCATQGIYDFNPLRRDRWERLAGLRTGDGRVLPARLQAEIGRELKRLELVQEMIAALEAERDAVVAAPAPEHPHAPKIQALARLKGVGPEFATVLVGEVFHRAFDNRRQVAAYVGLTPSPWRSGGLAREQGIAKSLSSGRPAAGPGGGQPEGAHHHGRAHLDVAAPPARERAQPLVPATGRRDQGAAAPDRHRGAGTQAAPGAVALPRDRPGPRRRRAQGLTAKRRDARADGRGGCVTAPRQGCRHSRGQDGSHPPRSPNRPLAAWGTLVRGQPRPDMS